MEGLIQQPQAEQQPAAQPQAEQPQGMEQDTPIEQDQAYQEGTKFVNDELYGGQTGDDIARAIEGNKNPEDILAFLTLQLVVKADEVTGGNMAEENYIPFAADVLEEVAEVAEAAGVEVDEVMIGNIFKKMIINWLKDNGVDTTQIEQSMSQISDEDYKQVYNQLGE